MLAQAASGQAAEDSLLQTVMNAFINMRNSAVEFLPKLVLALILFLIGYLVALFVRKALTAVTRKIGFDKVCDKVGITDMLSKAGIRSPLSVVLGKIVFWFLILFFLRSSADALQIKDISMAIAGVLNFIPGGLTAIIILAVGYLVADLIKGMVYKKLEGMGLDYASTLANLIYGLVFIMVLTVALDQIGISTELLNSAVKIVLMAGALAVALAMGLGLKDLARSIVSGVYARDLYKPDSTILHEGQPAKVVAVGPVTTRLETEDGEFIMVPNSQLVSEVVRGKD